MSTRTVRHANTLPLIASLLSLTASAALSETYPYFEHKAWTVTVGTHDDGDLYCASSTSNKQGEKFNIMFDGNRTAIIFVVDSRHWNGSFKDDVKIDIDYEQWTATDADFRETDNPDANGVYFHRNDMHNFGSFVDHLFEGNAIALKNKRGDQSLATWSLAGSAATLTKLAECGETVKAGSSQSGYGAHTNSGYGSEP